MSFACIENRSSRWQTIAFQQSKPINKDESTGHRDRVESHFTLKPTAITNLTNTATQLLDSQFRQGWRSRSFSMRKKHALEFSHSKNQEIHFSQHTNKHLNAIAQTRTVRTRRGRVLSPFSAVHARARSPLLSEYHVNCGPHPEHHRYLSKHREYGSDPGAAPPGAPHVCTTSPGR